MAPTFGREVFDAASRQREVTLTTFGRKTGKRVRVTIWISTDGEHLYVRSGRGMARDWPQNLVARGEAILELGGRKINVKPRRVTDPAEARATSELLVKKYGYTVKPSRPDEPLTPGEQATFGLLPTDR